MLAESIADDAFGLAPAVGSRGIEMADTRGKRAFERGGAGASGDPSHDGGGAEAEGRDGHW